MATKDKRGEPLRFSVGQTVRIRSGAPGGARNRLGKVVAVSPAVCEFPYEVLPAGAHDTFLLSREEVRTPTPEELQAAEEE